MSAPAHMSVKEATLWLVLEQRGWTCWNSGGNCFVITYSASEGADVPTAVIHSSEGELPTLEDWDVSVFEGDDWTDPVMRETGMASLNPLLPVLDRVEAKVRELAA